MKKIVKINTNGELVEYNNKLGRFELIQRPWSWGDITRGYIRESKRNYKRANAA